MKRCLFFCLAICLSIVANAQTITVTGVVTDATDGETIIGAAVIEDGTSNGVLTDINGCYIINVRPSAILVYDAVGYLTTTEKVNGRRVINVSLERDPDDTIIAWPPASADSWLFMRNDRKQNKDK